MSSKRFATEEVLAQIFDGNSDVEEEISESEDLSETENNAIDDPDCEFSYDEEDSGDQSGVVYISWKQWAAIILNMDS